ncbi:uncharacterized protein LOC119682245 [Teleopsis dalmanni]|uniref:uncharacterized protein LOC119682245 n=1 Tax=Teleopsis dalmanni TaxID=139649 RepID=UPI0018CF7DAE|nr:uncharacterized protein LOC119682245 [Teleopsis dalmanni]
MEEKLENIETSKSTFKSSAGVIEVGERKIILRVLKMGRATLLFINNTQPEIIDQMALAMCMRNSNEIVSTAILGDELESQSFAEKLCKRFGRPFYVSYNIQADRLNRALLDQNIMEYIRNHESEFI